MVFQHHRPHLAGRSPLFSASSACLLIALLGLGCSSPHTGISSATSTRTPGSSLLTPTAPTSISQTSPTVITNLGPVTTPLAPPPQDCAIKPPPQQKHLDGLGLNTNVQLVGGGVFWIYGMFYASVLHLSQPDPAQRWPTTKWVVEVGPNYALPVTLRLRDTQTNTLAWWTDGQAPPKAATQMLILLSTWRARYSAWPIRSRLVGMGTLPRFLRCRLLLPGGELVWRFLAEHHGCRELMHTHETFCVSSSTWSQPK